METISCAACGTRINITKENAYDRIKKHKEHCNPRKMTMAIGFYLSKKEREVDIL